MICAFVRQATNRHLTRLSLASNLLCDKGLPHLWLGLLRSRSVVELELRDNEIGPEWEDKVAKPTSIVFSSVNFRTVADSEFAGPTCSLAAAIISY